VCRQAADYDTCVCAGWQFRIVWAALAWSWV